VIAAVIWLAQGLGGSTGYEPLPRTSGYAPLEPSGIELLAPSRPRSGPPPRPLSAAISVGGHQPTSPGPGHHAAVIQHKICHGWQYPERRTSTANFRYTEPAVPKPGGLGNSQIYWVAAPHRLDRAQRYRCLHCAPHLPRTRTAVHLRHRQHFSARPLGAAAQCWRTDQAGSGRESTVTAWDIATDAQICTGSSAASSAASPSRRTSGSSPPLIPKATSRCTTVRRSYRSPSASTAS
jgi:hypothetical protein